LKFFDIPQIVFLILFDLSKKTGFADNLHNFQGIFYKFNVSELSFQRRIPIFIYFDKLVYIMIYLTQKKAKIGMSKKI